MSLDRLYAAMLAADDAARREHVARVCGDIDAAELAAYDREGHVLDVHRIRAAMADWLLAAVRAAVDLHPGTLTIHLDPAYRGELDVTQAAVVEAEHRLDDVEDAVIALECGRGVADVAAS